MTGTIPTFSYFPSSTIPVNLRPTGQPSIGAGSGNQNGNGAGRSGGGDAGGNKASNGTAGGAGDGSSNGGQASENNNLADLLRGILDLLGN